MTNGEQGESGLPDQEPPAVDRRRFLHSAAALGAAAVVGEPPANDRAPIGMVDVAGPRRLAPQEPEFELNEVSIADLQTMMEEGRHTARSVLELYLRRIDRIDRAGPGLKSIVELNPDATRIADELDAERRAGKVRGPLHGVPVVLKDVIDTADHMHTTAGSFALMGSFAQRDAYIVERLRAAGAVIVGKTNLTEWSNARSPRATAGWSARGGLTKNPYVLDRSACGSSSGTAVAIAANLATIGIGVETDGSISCPASANCLVGIRPTVGLWSRSGIIPLSYTMDTPGPMARTVTDAAILLGALTGVDMGDIATDLSEGHAQSDYRAALDPKALRGSRIGVLAPFVETSPPLRDLLRESLRVMADKGATIVGGIEAAGMDELAAIQSFVMLCELKDSMRDYLRTRGPTERHRTLADLIRFNQENADLEMPWFEQEWFEAAEATQGRATIDYRPALARLRTIARAMGFDRILAEYRLDAIVGIASAPPFVTDLLSGDRSIIRNSSLSAVAGYPRVTVPAGFIQSLPVGISFMGGPWSEARLIGLAYAFEQTTQARKPPHFLQTAVMDR